MPIPDLVQYLNDDFFPALNDATLTPTVFTSRLLYPTLSGNCLVLATTYRSGNTVTITDDKGNTWPTTSPDFAAADDGTVVQGVWVLPNCIAGTQVITLTLSANVQFESVLKPLISEW